VDVNFSAAYLLWAWAAVSCCCLLEELGVKASIVAYGELVRS
jgi:hypothetical protein